jgi:hypothetical protein
MFRPLKRKMSAHAHLYGCQMGLFHIVCITAQNIYTRSKVIAGDCSSPNLWSAVLLGPANLNWSTHRYEVQYLECLRLGFLDSKNGYPLRKTFEAFSVHLCFDSTVARQQTGRTVNWGSTPGTSRYLPDFKLSPRSECRMLSSGWFPGVCSLKADVSEHCLFHLHRRVGVLHTSPHRRMGQTWCSETLAFKLQTPGNHPEESIRQTFFSSPQWPDWLYI